MDKNSLIILLGVLVAVNFIALMILGKSSKKSPKAAKKKDENHINAYDFNEVERKTEIVGRGREKSNSSAESNSRPSFEKIPELSDHDKNKIINETVIESSPVEGNATEIMNVELMEKIYAELSFIDDGKERSYQMKKKEIFIGRDPEQCDLVISSDKFLGRKHVKLYTQNDKLYIEDLQSRNGTFVDGNKITGVSEVASKKFKIANTEIDVR